MGGGGVGLDSGGGSRGASFGGLGMRAMFRLSLATIGRLRGQDRSSRLRVCQAKGRPGTQWSRPPSRYALRRASCFALCATQDKSCVARSAKQDGGEGGIRTHGTLARTTVFETVPIDHSGTSPGPRL